MPLFSTKKKTLREQREEEAAAKVKFKGINLEVEYEVGKEIGSGQFAVVRSCVERKTGRKVAAKFIKKKQSQSARRGVNRIDIVREVQILKRLNNDHIMKLYDVYEDRQKVVLLIELVSGGELFDYLSENEYLAENETSCIIKQILEATSYLHSMKIAHLDLKPENIMVLDKNVRPVIVKLIDFGLSHVIIPGQPCKAMNGTPEFVSPEVLAYEPVSFPADVWSIGVITYILLSGCSPFLGDDKQETFERILDIDYDFDEEVFQTISDDAKNFIADILVRCPSSRPSCKKCLKNVWIASVPDITAPKTPVVEKPSPFFADKRERTKSSVAPVTDTIEEEVTQNSEPKPIPAILPRKRSIDYTINNGSFEQALDIPLPTSAATSAFPSMTSLNESPSVPRSRKISNVKSSSSSDNSDPIDQGEKESDSDSDTEDYLTPEGSKSGENDDKAAVERKLSEPTISNQNLLAHQKRFHSLIPAVSAKQKILYSSFRRVEEDLLEIVNSVIMKKLKTVPVNEVKNELDIAESKLDDLREEYIDLNGKNRKKARQFAEKLTSANLNSKFNRRKKRLEDLKRVAQEHLDWMQQNSLNNDLDDIIQQLDEVQAESQSISK